MHLYRIDTSALSVNPKYRSAGFMHGVRALLTVQGSREACRRSRAQRGSVMFPMFSVVIDFLEHRNFTTQNKNLTLELQNAWYNRLIAPNQPWGMLLKEYSRHNSREHPKKYFFWWWKNRYFCMMRKNPSIFESSRLRFQNQLFVFFRVAHVKVYKILRISCTGKFSPKSLYRGHPSHLKSPNPQKKH